MPDDRPEGDAEIAEQQLSFLEGLADKWAADVNLLSMIENVVSPMRLNRSAPQRIRDEFTYRMKVQIDAICRQCFLEGALCAMDGIHQSRGDRDRLPHGLTPRCLALPVSPDTCTVLGYRVKLSDPQWRGLDFANAEILEKANALVALLGDEAPTDLHLSVPFAHPDDPPEDYEGVKYRVRPIPKVGKVWRGRIVESVSIEAAPDMTPPWRIIVRLA